MVLSTAADTVIANINIVDTIINTVTNMNMSLPTNGGGLYDRGSLSCFAWNR